MTTARRAVVVAAGSGGDVWPMAEIAGRLAGRGLDVTLLAPNRYRGMAAEAGIAFRSIGADQVFEEVFNGPSIWDPRTGLATSWRYYGAAMRSGLAEIRTGWSARDTLLVSSSFAVAARLAEELDGFPNVTVHLSPAVIFSGTRPPRWPAFSLPPGWPPRVTRVAVCAVERLVLDPVIGQQVNTFRAQLGLPSRRRLLSRWLHSPRRAAYAFPQWFAPAADDWPTQGAFAGFPRRSGPRRPLPDDVGALIAGSGGPLVVVTAGTAVAQRPSWVSRIVEALSAWDARVILVEPSTAGPPLPGRVCRVTWVPFEMLLPLSRLIIHHGGIGTLAEALRAGIPQIAVPGAHDQPDNAARLKTLGVGCVLGSRPSPTELRGALSWALDSSEWRAAAEAIRRRLESAPDGAQVIADTACGD